MSQGPYNNLSELQTYLLSGANLNGTVVLDDTFLSPDVLTAMQTGLQLTGQSLTLQQVAPGNITLTTVPTPTLIIAGGIASDQVSNLSGAVISVAIQQTTANDPTGYDLIVNVGLPSNWTLGTSFPQLAGLQLPTYLAFASGPFLFFSSFATSPTIQNFPPPSGPGLTPIQAGLNYFAEITPGGVFGLVVTLLDSILPTTQLPIAGIITPDPIEFDLHAPVTAQATIDLDYIKAYTSAPWLGIRVVDASGGDSTGSGTEIQTLALAKSDDGDTKAPALLYYLGVNVTVQNQDSTAQPVVFEIDVQIPPPPPPPPPGKTAPPPPTTFEIALNPVTTTSSAPLSLASLSQVLFNSSSSSQITNAVQPLASVLSTVTLQNLTATFDITNFGIQSVAGTVGTSSAGWSVGVPGLPTTLVLTLSWNVDFTTTSPTWSVDFTATMTINGTNGKDPLIFSVEVQVPDLTITGKEIGSIELGLSDLGAFFGSTISSQTLGDVASLTFTNFTIVAQVSKSLYTVSGELSVSLNLFGVQLLTIQDMQVGLTVDASSSPTVFTFTFDGTIMLGSVGIAASGTVSSAADTHTVFTMHLVNETVGSMLNALVQLVDPSFSITFDAPWDAFFNISLDALVLTVDVTAGTVSLTYNASINLVFIEIDSIGLTYTKATDTAGSNVQIELTGSFLGQSFGTGNPLSWDAMNDSPPSVPAPKPPVFDLVYAGLGQHVQLVGDTSSMASIMKLLQSTVIPVQAGSLPSIGPGKALQFNADSSWLIGAQFTVMGTVSISAIFNDPTLYGILISLAGDQAGSFAGLSFEIIYRKVTDSIGVYSIVLTLPEAVRNLQFGEVSITLPVVSLDIYTNGNFRVDFGFPVGLDFSNSFCIQVFPFVGYGGFYFALLDGSTSTAVPQITNGNWTPVIEFGIALSIGVGKTVDEGILSGGISVTVVGILQGVLAWFNPTDNSSKEMYYWFQGSISIVGKLYATINFGIIQASLSVTAYATVTLTIQSHEPIYISINAGVSVEVSVKIIFFTVHFSFSASVSASFTIGSATPTPWIVASGSSGGGSGQQAALARTAAPAAAALFSGLPRLHAARVNRMMARPGFLRAMRKAMLQAPPSITSWPAFNVFPTQTTTQQVNLWAMPGFTTAGTPTTVNAIFLLAAQNSVPATAVTRSQRMTLASTPEAAAVAPFNLLMQAMLSWGIFAIVNPNPPAPPPPYAMPASVTADQLEQLIKLLKDPTTLAAAFNYDNLVAFLAANFYFNLVPPPEGTTLQGTAVFPVIPAITLSDNANLTTPVNFSTPTVDDTYAAKVQAYFALLQVQFEQRNQNQNQNPQSLAAAFTPTLSVAEIVFSQYFNMLMSAGVKAASDLMAQYPYAPPQASSIDDIANAIGDPSLSGAPLNIVSPNQDLPVLNTGAGAQLTFNQVTFQIQNGIPGSGTWQGIAGKFIALNVLNTSGQPFSVNDLLAANGSTTGIFNPAVTLGFNFTGSQYQTLQNETFDLIAARLLVRAGTPGLLNALTGLTAQVAVLQGLNDATQLWVKNPNTPIPGNTQVNAGGTTPYFSVANGTDTLTLIAAYGLYTAQQLLLGAASTVAILAAQIQALNPTVSPTPPATTPLNIPPVARTLAANDTIASLAGLLLTTVTAIQNNLLSPANLPYVSNPGDTLNLIAARTVVNAGGGVLVNSLPGLAAQVTTLTGLNTSLPAGTTATSPLATGTTITLSQGVTYTTVAGDTLTLIAAYQLEITLNPAPFSAYVAALLVLNPTLTNPTVVLTTGTTVLPPPAGSVLLAPGVLNVPLIYPIQTDDTFSGIATKFNLTLQDVADAVAPPAPAVAPTVFAALPPLGTPNALSLTITDLLTINVQTLLSNLLTQAEFNNASGLVSRFLLSGLQLPDPNNTAFQNLTPPYFQNPTELGGITTLPLYQLTGQQYQIPTSALTTPPPSSGPYQITLVNNAAATWMQFNGGTPGSTTPFQFPLIADQLTQANAIAADPFQPAPSELTRLALFQMVPPRIALQNHIQWQAAVLPPSFTSSGNTPGNPGIWLFPDSLLLQLENAAPPPPPFPTLLYQVVVAKTTAADAPVVANPAQQYLWGTIVDFTISVPVTDGPSASLANTYVIGGADDTGAALLQQVYTQIQYNQANKLGSATLYILYSPNPSSGNPSGLVSDNANAAASYILKTNLSTINNSGTGTLLAAPPGATAPDPAVAAPLNDPLDFVALVFEASVTRSGGFYLNYFNGTAALPSTVFGNSSTATISLLILLDSQSSPDSSVLPFNNCAVVADNIDATTSTVFVQPAIYVVQAATSTTPQDTLTTATNNFNTAYGASFTTAQVAVLNQSVQLLLLPGAQMTIPGQGTPYTIQYGDTLLSIATAFNTIVTLLVAAGSNLAALILNPGSPMQFANNVLTPATTVPPGTTGFEMTMPNESADQVGSLFNMLGYNIATAGVFTASGAGLPATPSSTTTPSANGLGTNPPSEDPTLPWYYTQSLAVSPFATTQYGSASAALPPAAQNPYNGVGSSIVSGKNVVNPVTIDLELLDIYGNSMQLPTDSSLQVPVGYYDNIISLGSWPSMAITYTVSGASPIVTFDMSMQQARYIPAPGIAVKSSLQAIAADYKTYTSIYYQLAQPDFNFTFQTTLAQSTLATAPTLSSLPFLAFARGAYVYLATLNTLTKAEYVATSSGVQNQVASVANTYGVSGAQLFTANQNHSLTKLFGTPTSTTFPLQVPQMYSTANGDTLQSIANGNSVTVPDLVGFTANVNVQLAEGVDLTAARPGITAGSTDSLASLAAGAHASAVGLVTANATNPNILVTGATFTVGTQPPYSLKPNQSFTDAANALKVSLATLATANQFLTNIFVNNAALTVNDIVTGKNDTLQTVATACGTTPLTLATNNETVPNIFATATGLQVGWLAPAPASPPVPTPGHIVWYLDDTLATLAQNNKVTVNQLGAANQTATAIFFDGAEVRIPGVVNPAPNPTCTYTAGPADTLGNIATKFGQTDGGLAIAQLNPDIPGLFIANQTIQTVTTSALDTFDTILAKLQNTLTLAQLVALITQQTGLIQPGGLWICPPMLGGVGTQNPNTLAGLAAAYNTDALTLGTANAAVLNFLASGVSLATAQWPGTVNPLSTYATNGFATLNAMVNFVNQSGFTLNGLAVTVADVIAAVSNVAGLISATALVLPVPPPNSPAAPSPLANTAPITPSFAAPVFQISVNIISGRNTNWVDPDFTLATSVFQSTYSVTPNPNPQPVQDTTPTYSLTNFANQLEASISGLKVASGDSVSEFDPASAATIWGVNFGSSAGPQLNYLFDGKNTQYFALPPLSTTPMGGPVPINPYKSGSGLDTSKHTTQTFQSVDLDAWMQTFLTTVDLFLTPAYASGAYAIDPADTLTVIGTKTPLAQYLSARMDYVLTNQKTPPNGGPALGSVSDAAYAMNQAMLTQLDSAYTVDTLVQVPVTVSNASLSMEALLSGNLQLPADQATVAPGTGASTTIPSSYSFSTATVDLPTNSSSGVSETATFLFSVKSPSANKSASLNLEYVVNQLELPQGSQTLGGYENSNWLKFVVPIDNKQSQIGKVDIPIPLRAYPSPVLLASQSAVPSNSTPAQATDLLGWNMDFIYQHDDAEQDTPTVVITFNPPSGKSAAAGATANSVTEKVFEKLANFMAAYPLLKNDLALLPTAPPPTDAKALNAVKALAILAGDVATALQPSAAAFLEGSLKTLTYAYQFQKESDGTNLTTLVVTSVDPATGVPKENPTQLWPVIYEYSSNTTNGMQLTLPATPPPPHAKRVTYTYAEIIPADAQFPQQFFFGLPWGQLPSSTTWNPPPGVTLPNAQIFQFVDQNILSLQSGRAGVSIARNLALVGTPKDPNPTNPAFVYETPLTSFTGAAVPYNFAPNSIPIPGTSLAQALGTFLEALFTTQNTWGADETVNVRMAAAYSYAVATTTPQVGQTQQLGGLVPILLVPNYPFYPSTQATTPDWDAADSTSFVSQLQTVVDAWSNTNSPAVSTGATYIFDLTVYADTGDLQPIIRAATLTYTIP
jgi:hypothetical protein